MTRKKNLNNNNNNSSDDHDEHDATKCLAVDLSLDSVSTASSTDTESSYFTQQSLSQHSSSDHHDNHDGGSLHSPSSTVSRESAEGATATATYTPPRIARTSFDLMSEDHHHLNHHNIHHPLSSSSCPSSSSPGSVLRHRTHHDVGGAVLFPSPSADSCCSTSGTTNTSAAGAAGAGIGASSPTACTSSSREELHCHGHGHGHIIHLDHHQNHHHHLVGGGGGNSANSDSDSEHGLVPRSRRRATAATCPQKGGITTTVATTFFTSHVRTWSKSFIHSRRFQFYALSLFVGITTMVFLQNGGSLMMDGPPFNSHSSSNNSNAQVAEWKAFVQHQVPILRKTISKTKHELQDGFTILLSGRRIDLLQQSLDVMSSCPSVKSIQVDYRKSPIIPASLLSHGSGKVTPATRSATTTTTTTTKSTSSVTTDAVFVIEEGLIVSCPELEKGFRTWKNDPSRLVGFFGYRGMTNSDSTVGGGVGGGLVPVESGSGSYAYVSDRAVYTHRAYLETFSSENNSLFDDGSESNCCDVSLSLIVSLAMGRPPVVLKAKPVDLLEAGLSKHHKPHHGRTSTTTTTTTNTQIRKRNMEDSSSPSCNCSPSWLQNHDLQSIPHSHSAVVA